MGMYVQSLLLLGASRGGQDRQSLTRGWRGPWWGSWQGLYAEQQPWGLGNSLKGPVTPWGQPLQRCRWHRLEVPARRLGEGCGPGAAGASGRGGGLWKRAACALSPKDTGPLGCPPQGRLVQQGPLGRGGEGGSGSAALLPLPFPAMAGPSPGSLPKDRLLARASVLAAPACLASHGVETVRKQVLSFSSRRLPPDQAAQGATQQGPEGNGDSSSENESKFNAALLCKGLWDAPPELLCTRAGGVGAGEPAPERAAGCPALGMALPDKYLPGA